LHISGKMSEKNIEKIIAYAERAIKSEIENSLFKSREGIRLHRYGMYVASTQDAARKIREAEEMGFEVGKYSQRLNEIHKEYRKWKNHYRK